MKSYDPLRRLDATAWLELDESERIGLISEYHKRSRVKIPGLTAHAAIHSIVETQVAMGDETPVAKTLERLQAEGLDRHDAVHAIGSVLAQLMHDVITNREEGGDLNEGYRTAIEDLDAKTWRDSR